MLEYLLHETIPPVYYRCSLSWAKIYELEFRNLG